MVEKFSKHLSNITEPVAKLDTSKGQNTTGCQAWSTTQPNYNICLNIRRYQSLLQQAVNMGTCLSLQLQKGSPLDSIAQHQLPRMFI